MMDKQKLRRADFVTSIILVLFGIWILHESFQMPMRDSFGGVQNVWYVSPALFPLIIGSLTILLGVALLIHSIISGGAKYFLQILLKKPQGPSEATMRFIVICMAILFFVYLHIPRIDFFLSVSLFLIFLISIFYLDDKALFQKLALFYFLGNMILLVLFAAGADRILGRVWRFCTDCAALIFWLTYIIYAGKRISGDVRGKRMFRTALLVSLIVPVILCPVFRYLLLVPLPTEGIVVELMNWIRYSLG